MRNRDRTPGISFRSPASEKCAIAPPQYLSARSITLLLHAMGGMRRVLLGFVVFLLTLTIAHAQWEIEDSHTTASLRGIHNVGGGVAWASGTGGTVLRTLDDGKTWQTCPIPLAGTKDTAEKLDFRGIQAFDANTAIVMSSGPGDQSRLYKTTDGCQTWKLLFTNPDKDGFWDALRAITKDEYEIAGDAVDQTLVGEKTGHIVPVWRFHKGDTPAGRLSEHFFELPAEQNEGGFAGSNSTLAIGAYPHHDPVWSYQWLATQTPDHSYIHRESQEATSTCETCRMELTRIQTPMAQGSTSAGIFSLAFREDKFGIAVGGDFQKPAVTTKTAIFSDDAGTTWRLADTPPHGYRSAVSYDPATKTWITVGPNGTDISTDDGRNWRPLTPTPRDAPDAEKNWNALSLPFVVGPKGRIGKLRTDVLQPATKNPEKR